MQARALAARARRGLKKPPRVIAARLAADARAELERFTAPVTARRLNLLAAVGAANIEELWQRLADRPFVAAAPVADRLPESERARILDAADAALARRVDLLGSGPVELGRPIDWQLDPKSGFRWEPGYGRSLEIAHLDKPNDVKWPWELSRMQWLVPAGQAFLLTGDERHAESVRGILDEWIAANPYAYNVNWACTMDVALRAITWTWLFHAFAGSRAWANPGFRTRLLSSLYLHGLFTERNLERSDVNGNHYSADAAGLVFVGLFFGVGAGPERWSCLGWEILSDELPKQVFPDGVDFEASTAYHRLVTELFLLAALYRQRVGHTVAEPYADRLRAAARFVASYMRPDGTSPLWGDADDARTLPFGGQALGDHRYLIGLVAEAFGDEELRRLAGGPTDESLWLLPAAATGSELPGSAAFPDGGVWILRNELDHVFADCGPIGLAGRGGHGHNDALSFEAVLSGTHLITDCGAYVYTSSVEWRNRFRSTAFHNTPIVDGEEQNRLVAPNDLWHLRDDAQPELRDWRPGPERDLLRIAHGGYRRLPGPVVPVRTILLEHATHRLLVHDAFEGESGHELRVPFHLATGVSAEVSGLGAFTLRSGAAEFHFTWLDPDAWTATIGEGWCSPSYGVREPIVRLELSSNGAAGPLTVAIGPADASPQALRTWAREALEAA